MGSEPRLVEREGVGGVVIVRDSGDTMAVGGSWRRPRMKVYDCNQEFGGNYFQPMIQYINHKNMYGPFSRKADVYLPHPAEVSSAKYTNMRYNDKSSAKHNLDQFLVDAHRTQIKELHGTTAMARVNLMKNIVTNRRQPHSPLDNVTTPYNPVRLLKGGPPGQETVNHYISELSIVKDSNDSLDIKQRKHLVMIEACDVPQSTACQGLHQSDPPLLKYYS